MTAPQPARQELSRDLGAISATAVVVGTIIGSGIFLVPSEMMQAVGSAGFVYLAWIVGGLLSFLGALTYAELGAMKPDPGGEYVYLRDAYGPTMGFVYAWTTFLIAKPGSIATIVTGMVRILGTFPSFSFLGATLIKVPIAISGGQIVAIAMVVLISFINYIGVKRAGEFQVVFTVLKVAIILGVILVSFFAARGGLANFATHYSGARGGPIGFAIALLAALWAYDGWNNLNMVAGEIRNPGRNVPISLIAGVAIVGGLYMLMNAAVLYVMPASAIAASPRPASQAVLLTLGAGAASLFSGLMAVQMLATLNGTVMSGGRVPFAAARDGSFVPALARVHPRFHTPSTAIVFQAVLAIVLLLFAGSFQQLFSITLFAEWLFYMITSSTVFIFRKKEPDTPRPYKTFGYPVVPALFIVASGVLLVYTFASNVKNSLIGTVIILAGIPVSYYFRRRRSA
ncbi:MAG TPA: amino acid permease [Candidatus Koribacter sp.]|jgi:APA family basic amino acid/polyamine antiporter